MGSIPRYSKPMAITCIGLSMTETIAFVQGEMPEVGTSARMPEQVKGTTGGMAVNAARACMRWGSLGYLVTKAGQHLSARLREEFHGRLLLCPTREGAESSTCVTLVHATKDPRGRERTFLLFPGRDVNISSADLDSPQVADAIRRSMHLHFAGVGDGDDDADTERMCFDNVRFRSQLQRWREAGKTVSFDFAPVRHRLSSPKWRQAIQGVLESADFLFPSDLEAVLLTKAGTGKIEELSTDLIEEAADKMSHSYPNAITIVKAKEHGCYCPDLVGDVDKGWVVAEDNVTMKDPTGAGDVYCGAFLTAWLRLRESLRASPGASTDPAHPIVPPLAIDDQAVRRDMIKLCAIYGNAAAADSLAKIGGGRGLPPWEDISKNRVAHHPALRDALRKKKSQIYSLSKMLGVVG